MNKNNSNPGFIWFVNASWKYIVDTTVKSKVEFFLGIIPSWIKFCEYCNEDGDSQ